MNLFLLYILCITIIIRNDKLFINCYRKISANIHTTLNPNIITYSLSLNNKFNRITSSLTYNKDCIVCFSYKTNQNDQKIDHYNHINILIHKTLPSLISIIYIIFFNNINIVNAGMLTFPLQQPLKNNILFVRAG